MGPQAAPNPGPASRPKCLRGVIASPIVPPQRKFTAVAEQAMDFASLFNVNFALPIAGATGARYRIELTEPAGMSTAGGKQALQHIRLVPEDGSSAIVVGTDSPVSKLAELRSLRHVAELHGRRFKGARFPVDGEHYQALVLRLQQFFQSQGHSVVMVELAAADAPFVIPPPPPERISPSVVAVVVMAALVLAGVAGFFLTR
jgi:hypothetical protein